MIELYKSIDSHRIKLFAPTNFFILFFKLKQRRFDTFYIEMMLFYLELKDL